MGTYRYPDIATAHEGIVKTIFDKGYDLLTEDGEKTIEYEPVTLVIKHPFAGKRISEHSSFSTNYMNAYADTLIDGYSLSVDFAYDYYSRLNEYDGIIDQIQYIINKLVSEPESRRAQAITWMPDLDIYEDDVPCLQLIQCAIRDNKLNMNVVFRSNDMLMAFGANAYALTALQYRIGQEIIEDTDRMLQIGTYTHTALIPHIYPTRDASELNKFLGR